MNYRKLGTTGFTVSDVSLGAWQVGGRWGEEFNDKTAEAIINRAIDRGVTFIDTADVYSDGKSEAAVARVAASRREQVHVATKCGRRLQPHVAESYTPEKMIEFVEASLRNMKRDTIDLVQLHCAPTAVYYRPEMFEVFEKLREQGKIRNFGVSVEKVEEALKAIEYPNVTTVQIIFNMFRHRPAELFFEQARKRNIGVIVRLPLASGLLTGAMTHATTFGPGDHRTFNRAGEAFDKGETFSGVDLARGLAAVEALKTVFGPSTPLSARAIRWILMFPEVSCAIPGASKLEHVESNVAASALPALTDAQMRAVREVYDTHIRGAVHHRW